MDVLYGSSFKLTESPYLTQSSVATENEYVTATVDFFATHINGCFNYMVNL